MTWSCMFFFMLRWNFNYSLYNLLFVFQVVFTKRKPCKKVRKCTATFTMGWTQLISSKSTFRIYNNLINKYMNLILPLIFPHWGLTNPPYFKGGYGLRHPAFHLALLLYFKGETIVSPSSLLFHSLFTFKCISVIFSKLKRVLQCAFISTCIVNHIVEY
jgi:hypothetical protein